MSANCIALNRRSNGSDSNRRRKVNRYQPNSPRISVSTKPEPQKVRIKMGYCQGKSLRKLSREEQIDRATVTKIVREPDVANYTKGLREQWYTVGPACLKAVRNQLEEELDGNLGHRILMAMAVIPKVAPAAPKGAIEVPTLTEEEGQRRQAYMAGAALLEGNQQFGVDLHDEYSKKLVESAHADVVVAKKRKE
jgi:hypothetical protein